MSNPLPPGWSITNSSGSHAGPARPNAHDEDNDGVHDPDAADGLDIRPDSPGWEDVENDSEDVAVTCFFSDEVFQSAQAMLDHCKVHYSFDFLGLCKQHNLDFYSTVKLVNYVRTQVGNGNKSPDVSNPQLWASDEFLQPAMQDDAMLFCLDDVLDLGNDGLVPVDFEDKAQVDAARNSQGELADIEE